MEESWGCHWVIKGSHGNSLIFMEIDMEFNGLIISFTGISIYLDFYRDNPAG
jgi:hypothetical protein